MKSLIRIAIAAGLLLVVGGGVYLAFSDVPAPTQHVEKIISDDRFQR